MLTCTCNSATAAVLGDLLTNPTNARAVVIRVLPRYIVCDAAQDLVVFSMDLYLGNTSTGVVHGSLQQEGTFKFNQAGQVRPRCNIP